MEPVKIASDPYIVPGAGSMERLSRRLSQWLADRSLGIRKNGEPSEIRWIPKSPAEQEAWRQRRRTHRASEKAPRAWVKGSNPRRPAPSGGPDQSGSPNRRSARPRRGRIFDLNHLGEFLRKTFSR